MSDLSRARRSRQTDYNGGLHLTAVISVITGAALLAAAAFLLSYAGIHEIALTAGVPRSLAELYPLMFDTALVIACVAALALRGAPWWMRGYAALAITILLGVVAAGEAMHSAGMSLPRRPTAATLAAIPWALFLVGFGLGVSVFRYQHKLRARAPADDQGPVTESSSMRTAERPAVDQPDERPASWNAGAHAADLGVVQAEPEVASPSQRSGGSDAGGTSTSGDQHRREHRHWHQHQADDGHDGNN
jgi:hypothetical protein